MKYLQKHPLIMIVIGVLGISMSSIFVKFSSGPSDVTAAWRLIWTVVLMTPVVLGKNENRQSLIGINKKTIALCILSGLCLAAHFALWFESLHQTSVASSTTIVSTEVIWVSLGFCLILRGKLSIKAMAAIAVTVGGSTLIAFGDSAEGSHLYGDFLALLAALAVAAYMLIGKVVRANTSTTFYTYLVYLVCAGVLLLLCTAQGHDLLSYGFSPVSAGFLLAVFSTILGHSIFSWCLGYFSPSFVSASKLCEPVMAAALAALIFHEIPGPVQIAGCVLILSGVLFYSRLEKS